MLCKDVAEDIQSCKENFKYTSLKLDKKLAALKDIMPLVLVTAILRLGFLSLAIFNITTNTNNKQMITEICNRNTTEVILHPHMDTQLSQENMDVVSAIIRAIASWQNTDTNDDMIEELNIEIRNVSVVKHEPLFKTETMSLLALVFIFFSPVVIIYFLIQKYRTTTKIVSFNDCVVGMMSEVSFIYNWSLLSPEIGRKIQLYLNFYISGLGIGYCIWCVTGKSERDEKEMLYTLIVLLSGIAAVPLYLMEYFYGSLVKHQDTNSCHDP